MEWYPFLFLKFFRQLIFPCRHMCSLETLGTIPTSQLVFVENVFTSLVSLLFYGVQAALWKFDPEALEESDASHMQPCTESKDSGSS